jgi:quercetin dioxygenase-like cupin family protein
MRLTRLYTGADNKTHEEELEMTNPMLATVQSATGIDFRVLESGHYIDWHTAPRRQFVITLAGEGEIGLGDGSKLRCGPGHVKLIEDMTGQGHTAKVVSDQPRIVARIHLGPREAGDTDLGKVPWRSTHQHILRASGEQARVFTRLYTGADNKTHLEEIEITNPMLATLQSATAIDFRVLKPGHNLGFHNTPQRKFVITLAGEGEIGLGDGSKFRCGPGNVTLVEDLTGQGHTGKVVGDQPRIVAIVHLGPR